MSGNYHIDLDKATKKLGTYKVVSPDSEEHGVINYRMYPTPEERWLSARFPRPRFNASEQRRAMKELRRSVRPR